VEGETMSKSWLLLGSGQFPLSFRLERRVVPVWITLTIGVIGVLILNVSTGEYPISVWDGFKTLLGLETGNSDHAFIIYTLRLPRALVAGATGIGLAISGTILQSLTRNALAAPEILGINAGASLAAVVTLVLFPSLPVWTLPFSAFAGAGAIASIIYLLVWKKGNSPLHLILIGIGIGAIADAFTALMLTFGDITNISQALVWITGSVYGRSWEHLLRLLPWLIIFVPVAWFLSRDLNALHLGDDLARGLGTPVELRRGILWFTSIALAAACVATAGTLAFVGFISPHLARQLVGPSHEGLIPTAALVGGCMVLGADLLGRVLFMPVELPCGVITAILGAPYFLYLLSRKNR
jgi:iron complex transport system permease protein